MLEYLLGQGAQCPHITEGGSWRDPWDQRASEGWGWQILMLPVTPPALWEPPPCNSPMPRLCSLDFLAQLTLPGITFRKLDEGSKLGWETTALLIAILSSFTRYLLNAND